jgi:hypothetical protein
VNELAMNLAAERGDHGYLQFPVVSQTAIADMMVGGDCRSTRLLRNAIYLEEPR